MKGLILPIRLRNNFLSLLAPVGNSPWVRVSAASLGSDGDLLDEEEWRERFEEDFRKLDPPFER